MEQDIQAMPQYHREHKRNNLKKYIPPKKDCHGLLRSPRNDTKAGLRHNLIISQIHKLLIKRQKTVAIAESCTGGLCSALLTQVSGSSKYFILGVVTYSNKAKENILKIPASLIAEKGAVSKETAKLMANSIRKIASSDFGIGITGIAGPTGATPKKPVGTVFIAIDSRDKKICYEFIFKGNRNAIRRNAALKAIELLKTLFVKRNSAVS